MSMDVLKEMIDIINECGNALNALDHEKAARLLDKFDDKSSLYQIPIDLLFYRLITGAELALRIGRKDKSLSEIEQNLSLFDKRTDLKFKLLIKAGRLEASLSRTNISTRFISEALGVAEECSDSRMISEAYSVISHMFAPKYPGLSLYFSRKAELVLAKGNNRHDLQIIQIERALTSHILFLNNRNNHSFIPLENEAIRLVNSINNNDLNPHELRRFRYVEAFVKADEEALEMMLTELTGVVAHPLKSRIEEIYIGICLEKGLFDKAQIMLERYKEDSVMFHDRSDMLDAHINQLQNIIAAKIRSTYIPFSILKGEAEPTTLFDILDKYSVHDELWALENGPVRMMFPSYEQEGKFEAIAMPDGEVRLFPCGLAFNVYYRGQAEFFENSHPTLYRKGVTDSMRFVERVRYEELKRCVDDYPLTHLFRTDIYCDMPDGKSIHIPLSIDCLALAQHYGIKTELMDLTSDKFVAAFFATTYCVNDAYYPIVDKRNNTGVFYRYSDNSFLMPNGGKPKMRAVGLQPFSRPGEQAGLVYEMSKDENFNEIVISKEFFTHDKEVSEFIFNYTNRSKKLFPQSPLKAHADAIKTARTLSDVAFKMAKDEFYPEVDDGILFKWLESEGLTISKDVDFSFSEEEKKICIDEWQNGGCDETLGKIIIRPVMKA